MGEQPYRRVLVINPEETFDHLPQVLCEQQSMGWARDTAGFQKLAEKIRAHVESLSGTLVGAGSPLMPTYHGMVAVEAPRFVGRVREMWELHGQLTANRMSIITGVVGQAVAQVRGLGGNGKSLLAREYAIRFGPAYPGGVFWLNAYGHDAASRVGHTPKEPADNAAQGLSRNASSAEGPLDPQTREALRQDQVRDFAVRVGVVTEGLDPEQVESLFWRRPGKEGRPCLWIVDDLPSGLGLAEIEKRWNAQWGGASTLITTRSKEDGASGSRIDRSQLLLPSIPIQQRIFA